MKGAPAAVDIDGRQVHIGSAVQLNWLGVWYEGFVVEIGPKRNLCKVRDAKSKETVLLESSHLQLRDDGVADKRLATGARVVYRDGECGWEGVVETRSAVGAILVSWRKSGLSKEKLTWFELSHIAPIIHNELYVEHNQDILKARKSGLLHNDAIEPRPRTMDNLLYESGSDKETETLTKLAASKRYMAQRNRGKDSSSHCFEGERVADKEKKLDNSAPFALQPDPLRSYPLPPATVFMPLPPMMSHLPMMPLPPMMPHPPIMPLPPMTPHSNSYMSLPLDAHMKSASSFTSAPGDPHRSSSPHPRSLTRLGQAQSSTRHCITTYTTYTSGIPPHPSSKFLQGLQDANIGNRISGRRTKARGRRSTSTLSQTHSEPTHYPTKSNSTTKKPEVPNFSKEKSVPPTHMSQPTSHYSITSTQSQRSKDKSSLGKKEDVFQGATSPLRPRALPSQLKSDTDDSRLKQPQSTRGSEIGSERGMHSGSGGNMGERRPEMEVATDDEDEYSSVFTDNDETQVNDNKSDVAGLKVVSASPAYETVSHGGSTLLTCVAQSQHSVHYQWLREGKPISEHDPFFTQPAPGMLQIQMASLYLTGEYRCVVSDGHSSLERVFHLEVCSETLVSEAEVETHVGNIPPGYEAAIADTNGAKVNSPQPASISKPPVTRVKGPKSESSPRPTKSPPYTSPAVASLPQPSSGRDTPDTTGKEDDGAGNKKMRTEQENVVSTEKGAIGGSRRAYRNRCRASAALKNDMEIYLKGYGENYGGVSSQSPQLEISTEGGEGERWCRKKRPKEKKNKKKAKSSSQEDSSPVRSTGSLDNTESLKHPRKSKSFRKLPNLLLGKSRKKQGVASMEKTPPPTPAWTEETLPTPTVASDSTAKVVDDKEKTTSAAVQASVGGSSGSEERKKGFFLSNIFPRSRSS